MTASLFACLTNLFLEQMCPLVLDEITGSPAQEVLSCLLCFRETSVKSGSIAGTASFVENTLILATCNPDPARDSVFPLTPELKYAAIEVEPLKTSDERKIFIESQLQDIERGPGLESKNLKTVLQLVLDSSLAVDSVPEDERIGTISLRDGVRCASLMKCLGQGWSQLDEGASFFRILEKNASQVEWDISDEQLRVAALACYVCYGMRVVPRSKYFNALKGGLKVKELVEQIKEALVACISLPPTIVVTSALKDNILAILVAVSARIPLLCLGDDGTSKTLSLNLVLGQMQGRFSSSILLRSLMRVQGFHLQLSEASTAQHIVSLKRTLTSWHTDDVVLQSNPCV